MKPENPRFNLFKHLASQHNLILLDSELDEIANIVLSGLLEDIQNEEEEILMSPIRFNGVHIKKINEIFNKYGIKIENQF